MKKYTQAEFDAIPRNEHGYKICPTGDYTGVRHFGERCSFGAGCSFGERCSFGAWCIFGEECSFGEWCSFGKRCSFGAVCRFGEWCSFGVECRFGVECSFGERCICEFGEFSSMITAGGFGRHSRTTYFFNLADGRIGVRCGCFAGMLPEWRAKVGETYGDSHIAQAYLMIADAVEMQLRGDR